MQCRGRQWCAQWSRLLTCPALTTHLSPSYPLVTAEQDPVRKQELRRELLHMMGRAEGAKTRAHSGPTSTRHHAPAPAPGTAAWQPLDPEHLAPLLAMASSTQATTAAVNALSEAIRSDAEGRGQAEHTLKQYTWALEQLMAARQGAYLAQAACWPCAGARQSHISLSYS